MDNRKLKQILEEMTEISGIRFGLYDENSDCIAATAEEVPSETVQEFMRLMADEITVKGQQFIKFQVHEETMVLMVDSKSSESHVIGRMAVSQLKLFLENISKELDKNSCMADFLSGDVSPGDMQRLAGKLKLKDVARIVYILELSQTLNEEGEIRMLGNLFANGRQDLFFMKDETHLVLVKAFEKGVDDAQAKQFALSTVDTMMAELMIKTRIAYSNAKYTLMDLREGYKEANMALHISGIFQEQKEISAYSRLGIARLIYELPKELCESFLHEVFGDQLPDEKIDEELQVTIRKFFDNDLNISETARQLYLHRNTLVYRLERFEKAVGLDIRRFDDAMTFQIAMMVLAHYRAIR